MLKKNPAARKTISPAKKKLPAKVRVSQIKQSNLEKENPFTVVAIGASLGGVKAGSALLKSLPANTGMAYIYVQHLNPNYKSSLVPILAKTTKMKVQEIDDMELMKPNNVYVIPYNKGIQVTNGHIKLIPRTKGGKAISVDILFSSLAATHKANVIGVVLSGNASDGTIGLKAIKDAGGVTFAQDDSAQAKSMPQSAIEAGVVDFILSPEGIARKLSRLSKNNTAKKNIKKLSAKLSPKPRVLKKKSKVRAGKEEVIEENNPDLKIIYGIFHKEKNVDFTHYKLTTVKRRLKHRMLKAGVETIKEYAKLLLKKRSEVDLLYKDLLINVTAFFRDPEVFRYLKTTVFPKLLKKKTTGETLRLWVPACSTGEEVYSMAMLLTELQDNRPNKIRIQIFATDLSDRVIRDARIGEYSQNDIKSISQNYVKRFFQKTSNNTYRIVKELREMCVFASHNILRDHPFYRIDFVSCRNLLIYFDAAAQRKVISTLHFALNDSGYLMLGKSETAGLASQFFSQLNNKFKIFSRKKNVGIRKVPELAPRFPGATNYKNSLESVSKKKGIIHFPELDSAIDTVLLSHYMPACAIINKDMEIIEFRGSTSLYLSHSSGKATLNILKMVRPEFAFELRNAVHKAIKTKAAVRKAGIEMNPSINDSLCGLMTLEVRPLNIEWDEPLLLIVFTLQEQVEKYISIGSTGKGRQISGEIKDKDKKIKKLYEELNNARTEMHSFIESQENASEELQAANEEIVSTNEEFQTLNEELETSKEEIEATNEELLSANHDLKTHNELLAESYHYSEAIIATIHEPMIVLDSHLIVKSANKSFYKKFLVNKEETEGVSLFELGNKQWNIPKLKTLLETIVTKNTHFESYEVKHVFPGLGEKIMLLNASRIIQKIHREKLILLAIEDITVVKKAQEALNKTGDRFRQLVENLPTPVYSCDAKGLVNYANDAAIKLWGRAPKIGKESWCGSWKIYKPDGSRVRLDEYPMAKVYKDGAIVLGEELVIERPDGTFSNVQVYPQAEFGLTGEITGAINMIIDISQQKIAQKTVQGKNEENIRVHEEDKLILEKSVRRRTRELEQKNKELKNANKDLTTFTYVSSHDLQEPLRKLQNFTDYILKKEEKNLSKEGKGYFNKMKETAKRMQSLIEDLLTYSRAKNTDLAFEKTDLNVIVASVKNDFEESILQKKATITTLGLGKINVIPYQFNQLIQNLMGNSLKFSRKKVALNVKITSKMVMGSDIENEELTSKTKYCHITYTDNGIGFDPQYQKRIFEVFQRLHSYEEFKGTGIGLAICKRIVENHNGVITATGKLNKGARFDIYIPAN